MHRRKFISHTALTIAALTLLKNNSFAQLLINAGYKITMLTKNIGIFTEYGGTILFMIGKDGTIVVDSQFEESVSHLITALKKKTEQPFNMLINTHHHYDHTSGNIAFKNLTSTVLAHLNSKINQQNYAVKNNKEAEQYYPTETYTENYCKKINNEEICLFYYGAAHTNGDSVVYFKKANLIHLGDLVFNRLHPYVDRSAGASIKSWITVLEKITTEFSKKTTFICGHAAEGYPVILKRADVIAFKDYLKNVLIFTASAIKDGKTLAQILLTKAIPNSPQWTGDGIERPLTAAYEELTDK